jgi:DNA-binding CsgD family transcriptional regulator
MSPQRAETQGPPADHRDVGALVRHSFLPVWLVALEDRRIIEASDAIVVMLGAVRERLLGRDPTDFLSDQSGARTRLALLASGEIDGFHVLRTGLRRVNGTEALVDAHVTAFIDGTRRRLSVGVILPASDARLDRDLPGTFGTTNLTVLGTVDDLWRIKQVSADVGTLLGYQADDVIGHSVESLVYAGDLPSLLIASGEALRAGGGASVHVHVRNAADQWQLCRALITPLAGNRAPRIRFAFVLTDPVATRADDRTGALEGHLRRIAREVAEAGVLAAVLERPTAAAFPGLSGLSWRQLEIVMGLLAGERVRMIARRLYLSESTVRNHLTSVYRKLGVSSQEELLTVLSPTIPDGTKT